MCDKSDDKYMMQWYWSVSCNEIYGHTARGDVSTGVNCFLLKIIDNLPSMDLDLYGSIYMGSK
jgi:hypothetical protein